MNWSVLLPSGRKQHEPDGTPFLYTVQMDQTVDANIQDLTLKLAAQEAIPFALPDGSLANPDGTITAAADVDAAVQAKLG